MNTRPGFSVDPVIQIDTLFTIYYNEFADSYHFGGEQHPFWEMVYVDKGTAVAIGGEKEYVMHQGSIIFHKPNEFHDIRADKEDPPNVIVITFSSESPAMHFFEGKQGVLPRNLRFHIREILENAKGTFILPMGVTLRLKEHPLFGGARMVLLHLEQLLIELVRQEQKNALPRVSVQEQNPTVRLCIQYLEEHIYGNITVNDVCAAANYSRTYICTLFRKVTGCSILEYYGKLKLEEAQHLIRRNIYSLSEISDLLGFNTPTYFSRFFTKACGMTPTQYRHSLLGYHTKTTRLN